MTQKRSLREQAEDKAYRLLAARARSERELRARLRERGFDETVVAETAARLREKGYLDDAAFARQWARHLAVDKLQGDRRIRRNLQERGISEEIAAAVLAEVRREWDEGAALAALARRRRMDRPPGDRREQAKWYRRLLARGFSPALVAAWLHSGEEGVHDDDGQ